MPKLKTHSGTKKRIRITKNAKVLRRKSMGNHFLSKKGGARKRGLAHPVQIVGKSAKSIKLKLGV